MAIADDSAAPIHFRDLLFPASQKYLRNRRQGRSRAHDGNTRESHRNSSRSCICTAGVRNRKICSQEQGISQPQQSSDRDNGNLLWVQRYRLRWTDRPAAHCRGTLGDGCHLDRRNAIRILNLRRHDHLAHSAYGQSADRLRKGHRFNRQTRGNTV